MSINNIDYLQLVIFAGVLLLTIKPLGWYMARVYSGDVLLISKVIKPFELLIYRVCCIKPSDEMSWKQYLGAMLLFNVLGMILVFLVQKFQAILPFNPNHLPDIPNLLAMNTAISYATNANWQAYSGETTMSYFTQMFALTSQNFLSAATGMAILVALIRGMVRNQSNGIGNYWVDMCRGMLYIFLPLAFLIALVLASQGVIQNLQPNLDVAGLENAQTIPMGPVASQEAIKQLGSNGGGFFNANSAHPFENPSPITNFIEMLLILLIPAASCYMFGEMVKDKRQGWSILTAMFIIFIPFLLIALYAESHGNLALMKLDISQHADKYLPNMEGKETRFGIANSVIWSLSATATSNGSVNSMLDSYTALGGMMPLWMMSLSEIIFGGVGNGLYNMLLIVIFSVFIGGLMVGRSPEYLGKKIEPFEIKMASLAIIIMPVFVLLATAFALSMPEVSQYLGNDKEHGLTEMLYAFTSLVKNNGSSFAGLNSDNTFFNILGAALMLIGRYWVAIPVLAISGSLVAKKKIPESLGTLKTYTPLFTILLICVAIILGALTFLPVLALGPMVEHLQLVHDYGH